MNITFIRRRWSPVGGAENYLLRLAAFFKIQGHFNQLICETWPSQSSFEDILELSHSSSSSNARLKKVNAFAQLANACIQKNPKKDRIYFSMERGIHADIYRAGDGLHRSWLEIKQSYRPFAGRISNWLNFKNKEICKLEETTFNPSITHRVIVISQMVKREILHHFDYPENRIHVIHNGVDYHRFANGNRAAGRNFLEIEPNQTLFLLVGHGAERKGHRFAREVVHLVKKKRINAELRIIDKPHNQPLENLYAATDIFLFPTLYDPFGSVVLEAMAAGLPVITTQACGGSECIEHGQSGWIVPRADCIDQMTEYALQTLEPDTYKCMSTAARQTAQQNTFEKSALKTLQTCEQVWSEKK